MRTYNIPIFVPHKGCPFDCVFCNQRRITGTVKDVTSDTVAETINAYLETIDTKNAKIEAAFFGGSFTGIPIEEQTALLSAAYAYVKSGKIDGIRLSTRPDYIDTKILDNLKKYGVTTIELGVQSMDDDVLLKSGRGHTAENVKKAAWLIKEYGFTLGLQMMTGLPGDTHEKSIYTAKEIIKLQPEIVRIYPTLTIKDTRLEEMYNSGEYQPQSVDEAAKLCKTLLLMFEKNGIKVIRLGLQSTDEICENGSVIAGPVHSAFGELVESEIYYDLIINAVGGNTDCAVTVAVNDREVSKAVGNRRRNILKIKDEKNINLKITGDKNINVREVRRICC